MIRWLDYCWKGNLRKFRGKEDGKKSLDGTANIFIAKMQLFLSVSVDDKKEGRGKVNTFRTCGHNGKRKPVWNTQHQFLIKHILDVLSEQHKSMTES